MRTVVLAVWWGVLIGGVLSHSAHAQVSLRAPEADAVEVADGGRATLAFRVISTDSARVRVAVDAPPTWRTRGPRTLALGPGARSVFVIVSPPQGAAAGAVPVRVTLLSPDTLAQAQVAVTIPERRAAHLAVGRPTHPLVAGEPSDLPVTLANDGNVPLTLDLTAAVSVGWDARLGQRAVTVGIGETVVTALTLTAPSALVESRGTRVRLDATDAGSGLVETTDVRVLAVPEPGALRLARHDLPGRAGVEVATRSDPVGGSQSGALVTFDAGGLLRETGDARLRVSVRAPAVGGDALAGRDLYRAELSTPTTTTTLGDAAVDHGPLAGVVLGAGLAGEVERARWTAGAFTLGDRIGYLPGDRTVGLRAARSVGTAALPVRVGAMGLVRTGPLAGTLLGLRTVVEPAQGVRLDVEAGLGGATEAGGAARVDVRRGAVRLTAATRSTPSSFPLLTAGTVDARGEAALYVGDGHVSARATRYRVLPREGRVGIALENARLSGRTGRGLQWEAGGTRYVRDARPLAEGAARVRSPFRMGWLQGDLRGFARRRIAGETQDDEAGADVATRLRLGPAAEVLVGLGGSVSTQTGPAWRPSLGAAIRPMPSLLVRATVFAQQRLREGAQDLWGLDGALAWTARSGQRLSARVLRLADDADPFRLTADRWQALVTLSQPLAVPLARSRESGAVQGRVVDPETGLGLGGVPVFVGQTAALSAPDGSFALSGLPPGAYELTVGADAAGASPYALGAVPVRVGGGEVTRLADLAAPASAEVIGRALLLEASRTGRHLAGPSRPLGGVAIEIVGEAGASLRGVTDPEGAFRFVGLAPGRYTVRVDPAALPRGVTAEAVEIDLTSGTVAAVTLEAAPRRRTFRRLD